jgi:hypothetical protein
MILVYTVIAIITFWMLSLIYKRKRKNPASSLYNDDPEEAIPIIISGSLLWPAAIAVVVLLYIGMRLEHVYKRWERWINK